MDCGGTEFSFRVDHKERHRHGNSLSQPMGSPVCLCNACGNHHTSSSDFGNQPPAENIAKFQHEPAHAGTLVSSRGFGKLERHKRISHGRHCETFRGRRNRNHFVRKRHNSHHTACASAIRRCLRFPVCSQQRHSHCPCRNNGFRHSDKQVPLS